MTPELKWFKHQVHAHSVPNIKALISTYGYKGYGIYYVLLELIGQYNGELTLESWLSEELQKDFEMSSEEFGKMIEKLNDLKLITSSEDENQNLVLSSVQISDDINQLVETSERNRKAANARWYGSDQGF